MAYDFVIGVDVGNYFHHACVLDPQGRQVLSKRTNQHEGSLRKLFSKILADDAYVIAHAGLNLPDSLRSVDRVEEVCLQLKVLNAIGRPRSGLHTPD